MGPGMIATHQNRRYFITFTDNAIWYTVTYLLRTKDRAFEAYKSFEAWATTQQHCKGIKALHSDHGGEYLSPPFNQHLAKVGTTQRLTTHDTPQLNGIAEWLNRTLLESIQVFTHSSQLPKSLWGKVLRHATWLKNWTATCVLNGKMPFKALYGQPPDLLALRTWGTTIWVHYVDSSKLDICTQTVCWLGPDVNVKAHHVFWPSTGNVTVKRNIYFRTSALLKGEQNIPIVGSEQVAAPSIPSSPSSPDQPNVPHSIAASTPVHTNQPEQHTVPPTQPRCSMCTHFPSCIIHEQQAAQATQPPCKAPPLAPPDSGMPELTPTEEHDNNDVEESGGVWAIVDGAPMLCKAFEGLEYMLTAETADAEALEPCMLAKAKQRPD